MKPEALLETLTLEQKLAQLVAEGSPARFLKDKRFDREKACAKFPNGLFGLMVPIDLAPEEIGEWVGEMLDFFAELSPIPPLLICESLHGVLGQGTTVFPQSIGMGASFPQPVKKLAAIKRIALPAGKTVKVEIDIPKEQLMFTGITMQKQLEKG